MLPSCTIPWICDFLDIISDCGLSQINNLLNPCNNILDLSFVDLSICAIVRSDPLSIPEDIFHPTFKLSFVIDKMPKSNSNCFKSSKKVHRTDYFILNQLLSTINWESVFSSNNSVNNFISNLNYFYDKLNGFIAKCIPKRSVDTSNCPCWFTPELKSLKNRRNKIFNK